jgi:hypothetical protein
MPFRSAVLLLLILPFFLHSCKKDPLEGDKALFEGKWVWVQTRFYDPYATPATIYHYPEPNVWMNVEFFKKGRISMDFNDHDHLYTETNRRIVFDEFKLDESDSSYHFIISIKRGNYYKSISGILLDRSKDTLIIDGLPIGDALNSVTNYFIKE